MICVASAPRCSTISTACNPKSPRPTGSKVRLCAIAHAVCLSLAVSVRVLVYVCPWPCLHRRDHPGLDVSCFPLHVRLTTALMCPGR